MSLLTGAAWVGSSRLIVRLLGLCSTFVLARMLTPEDFGLVAVATGISGLLESFSALGFNQALIRFQDADEDDYATAWTLNVFRGGIIALVLLLLAYPLSLLLADERLLPLLLALAGWVLLRGTYNPRLIDFEKKLQFDVFFKVMLYTKMAGVAATIGLVFFWKSYWVLVVGMLVSDGVRCLLSFYYAPFKVNFTVKSWRKLFGFSGWIAGTQILKSLAQRLDPVILAGFATPHIVGVLHIARDLSNITFIEVAAPVRRVLFPALSQYDGKSDEFVDVYRQSVAGLFLVLAPVCIGFALTVPELVPLVLGDKWHEVIVPIQVIMYFLTFCILSQMAHSASYAKGQSKPVFLQSAILTPIKLTVYTLAVAFYGLEGAIFSICFDLFLATLFELRIGYLVTGVGFWQHIALVWRSLAAVIAMALFLFGCSYGMNLASFTNHLGRLIVLVFGGAAVYIFFAIMLWRVVGSPYGPERKILELFCFRLRGHRANG